jgi:hypothetical protein
MFDWVVMYLIHVFLPILHREGYVPKNGIARQLVAFVEPGFGCRLLVVFTAHAEETFDVAPV